MAADIRVARRRAGKMGLPEVSLGVLPGTGGTQRLLRIVGKSKAIELMATAELFPFERGLELGLVNQIFDAETGEQFMQQVTEYARAVHHAKQGCRRRWQESSAAYKLARRFRSKSALALERELQQQLFQSEDAKEGLDAYVNKRKAGIQG